MSEQWREQLSVSALKKQLVQLQSKVSDAHNRLHYTQVQSTSSHRGPTQLYKSFAVNRCSIQVNILACN